MIGLVDFWWTQLPVRASRVSRVLATALGEGLYLTVWPTLAALAPIVALVVGLVVGWERLGVREVFTQAPAVLIIGIALGSIAAQLGLLYALGYGVADLVLHRLSNLPRSDFDKIELIVAALITYAALAVLTAGIPLAVRALRAQTPLPSEQAADTRVGADMLIGGLTAALLTFLYVNALPMLVRPIFEWQGRNPNLSSIEPMQQGAAVFAVVAFIFAALRVLLEYTAAAIDPGELEGRAVALDVPTPSVWDRVPALVPIVLAAIAGTLLLGGIVIDWTEAGLLFVGLLVIGAARILLPPLVPAWPRAVDRVPPIVRVAGAVILGYIAGTLVVSGRLRGESFFVLIVGFLFTLAFMALLFPGRGTRASPAVPPTAEPGARGLENPA